MIIFDKKSVINFKRRNIYNIQNNNYDNFLINQLYQDIYDKISYIDKEFNDILEINIKSDFILKKFEDKNFFQSNIVNYFFGVNNRIINDVEAFCFGNQKFDLIISICDFHQINDIFSSLYQINNSLKKSSVFIAAIPIAGTLAELRHSIIIAADKLNMNIYPHIFPFIREEDLIKIMQKIGFSNIVLDILPSTISYQSVFDLIKELRKMGQSNSLCDRHKKFLGKELFVKLEEVYKELYQFGRDEIVASFNIATITAFK